MRQPYDSAFFRKQQGKSLRSAQTLLPDVLTWTGAKSMIDVGCGTGRWPRVALESGVSEVWGVDGAWVAQSEDRFPEMRFVARDLNRPLEIGRRFDLAISLDVGEHIEPASSDGFVAELASLADIVLFGAAIPWQGGRKHLNEQWPSSWAQRFAEHGMDCFDVIRPHVWQHPDVGPAYRQNTFLYVRSEAVPAAIRALPALPESVRDAVHPFFWERNEAFFDRPRRLLRKYWQRRRQPRPPYAASPACEVN